MDFQEHFTRWTFRFRISDFTLGEVKKCFYIFVVAIKDNKIYNFITYPIPALTIFILIFRDRASLETPVSVCPICLSELAREDDICTTPTILHAFGHFSSCKRTTASIVKQTVYKM